MLGYQEIIIILVVALLVFGPAKLPEIGRQVGGALRELRKMSGDVQRALDLDDNYSSSSHYSSARYDYEYKPVDSATTYSQGNPPAAIEGASGATPAAAAAATHSTADGETYDEAHHRFLYDPLAEDEDGRDARHGGNAAPVTYDNGHDNYPDTPAAAAPAPGGEARTLDGGAPAAAVSNTVAVEHKES